MKRDLEQFNTAGRSGRDCPICFRLASLEGGHSRDSERLCCVGCYTKFSLTRGDGATTRDTLTRIRTPDVLRPLTIEEMERVRGGVA